MSDFSVTKTRIYAGIWEGVITGKRADLEEPQIEVVHDDHPIQSISLALDAANTGNFSGVERFNIGLVSHGFSLFLIPVAHRCRTGGAHRVHIGLETGGSGLAFAIKLPKALCLYRVRRAILRSGNTVARKIGLGFNQ